MRVAYLVEHYLCVCWLKFICMKWINFCSQIFHHQPHIRMKFLYVFEYGTKKRTKKEKEKIGRPFTLAKRTVRFELNLNAKKNSLLFAGVIGMIFRSMAFFVVIFLFCWSLLRLFFFYSPTGIEMTTIVQSLTTLSVKLIACNSKVTFLFRFFFLSSQLFFFYVFLRPSFAKCVCVCFFFLSCLYRVQILSGFHTNCDDDYFM